MYNFQISIHLTFTMDGYDLSDIEQLESLDDENINFNVSFESPPKVSLKFQHLYDCRIQLLMHNTVYLLPGETKDVETNIIIEPQHGRCLQTIANGELGLIFKEERLFDQSEPYRLKVRLINIKNQNIALPRTLCCGYLIMK